MSSADIFPLTHLICVLTVKTDNCLRWFRAMTVSIREGTEVVSSDGKKIGKVKKIENDHYIIVNKKGLLTDEEIRVPLTAITSKEDGSTSRDPVRLNMTEESLKHGFEFSKGKPNSQFMHGVKQSEKKLEPEKQVIHFETVHPVDESNRTGIYSPLVSKEHQAVLKPDLEGNPSLYSCDMCPAKFEEPRELQEHRAETHKAPVNI